MLQAKLDGLEERVLRDCLNMAVITILDFVSLDTIQRHWLHISL